MGKSTFSDNFFLTSFNLHGEYCKDYFKKIKKHFNVHLVKILKSVILFEFNSIRSLDEISSYT